MVMHFEEFEQLATKTGHGRGKYYEAMLEELYSKILRSGDIVIDGGGNVGRHTIPMGRVVGDVGRVYSFEPAPITMGRLYESVRKAGLSNVILQQFALANQSALMTFKYVPTRHATSGLRKREDNSDREAVEFDVVAVALDDLLGYLDGVRFIKLDLEGGEYHALRGGQSLIGRNRPVIVFENGRATTAAEYGYTAEQFFSFFEEIGFSLVTALGDEFTYDDWERRPYHFQFCAYPSEKPETLEHIKSSAQLVISRGVD